MELYEGLVLLKELPNLQDQLRFTWTNKYSKLIKGQNQLNNKRNLEGLILYDII